MIETQFVAALMRRRDRLHAELEAIDLLLSADGESDDEAQPRARPSKSKARAPAKKRRKSKKRRTLASAAHRGKIDWKKGRKLWDKDVPAKAIAEQIGSTEGGVYGHAHTNGWGKRKKRAKAKRPAKKKGPPSHKRQILEKPVVCPHCGHDTVVNPCSGCNIKISGTK